LESGSDLLFPYPFFATQPKIFSRPSSSESACVEKLANNLGFAKNVPDMIPIKLIKIRQTFDRDTILDVERLVREQLSAARWSASKSSAALKICLMNMDL